MGLDMYLTKTKRASFLTSPEQYCYLNYIFENGKPDNPPSIFYTAEDESILRSCYKKHDSFYKTIFEEIFYWRKINHIHNWFVENVQSGNDDCETYEVTKDHLVSFLTDIKAVLNDNELAKILLPTLPGFFFGPTEYGEIYFDALEVTKTELEKILDNTNFDTEIVFYHASW